jgi:hypothetical protein
MKKDERNILSMISAIGWRAAYSTTEVAEPGMELSQIVYHPLVAWALTDDAFDPIVGIVSEMRTWHSPYVGLCDEERLVGYLHDSHSFEVLAPSLASLSPRRRAEPKAKPGITFVDSIEAILPAPGWWAIWLDKPGWDSPSTAPRVCRYPLACWARLRGRPGELEALVAEGSPYCEWAYRLGSGAFLGCLHESQDRAVWYDRIAAAERAYVEKVRAEDEWMDDEIPF